MSKIISFSVWGNIDFYLKGCFENIYLAKEIYPEWKTRFYCDSLVSKDFQKDLIKSGAEVIEMKTINSCWEGLFWRFLPASDPLVEVFISRDTDSRLNWRERAAVDEWLNSDYMIHSMRDHIEHNVPILGGMWGCKSGLLNNMNKMIELWDLKSEKGSDQSFLKEKVWNPYISKTISHDRYNKGLVIEQVVQDVDAYLKQRDASIEYRRLTLEAQNEFINSRNEQGLSVTIEELDSLFPPLPEIPPIKKDKEGRILIDYCYDPIKIFGMHEIRSFPEHKPMNHGCHVGEIIK